MADIPGRIVETASADWRRQYALAVMDGESNLRAITIADRRAGR
jgi:hypothetical protein